MKCGVILGTSSGTHWEHTKNCMELLGNNTIRNPHSHPPNKNLTGPLGCLLHHLVSCAEFLFVIQFVTIFGLGSSHELFPFLLSF